MNSYFQTNHRSFVKPKLSERIVKSKPKTMEVTNIFEVILPFFYILRIVGYACFSISGTPTEGIICTKPIDLTLFGIAILLHGLVLFLSLTNSYDLADSKILDIGGKMVLWSSILIALIASIMTFIFRERTWRIVRRCYNFDNQIAYFGVQVNHKRDFWIYVTYVSVSVSMMIASVTTSMFTGSFSWLKLLFFAFSNTNYMIVMGIFVLFMYAIHTRLVLFNKCIRITFLTKNSGVKMIQSKNLTDYIKRLAICYETLNEVVDLVNFCFSFQIMLCLGLFFVYTVLTVFAAYRIIFEFEESKFVILVSYMFWNALYFLFVLTILTYGMVIANEGRYTTTLIHKAINSINYGDVIERLSIFAQQVGQRVPVVTCGLFPFDWTIFFSIIASTATYLIILVQFESTFD